MEVMSVRLELIIDDIKLGTALVRLAALYFHAGDINQGIETRMDAEECHTNAERSSARLSGEDQEIAAKSIKTLRSVIDELSTSKYCKQSNLTAKDLEDTAFPNWSMGKQVLRI
jgi:hypothetical protein